MELPEQKCKCRTDANNPTEQGGNCSSHQERGTTAVNCQEVDMPSPAVQDPPSSNSTRPSRPKITRRLPECLSNLRHTYGSSEYRIETE